MTTQNIKERLEYLRGEIQAECISYSEISELQSLAQYIDAGDVELLEWAGVPEHTEECKHATALCTIAGYRCTDCGHVTRIK